MKRATTRHGISAGLLLVACACGDTVGLAINSPSDAFASADLRGDAGSGSGDGQAVDQAQVDGQPSDGRPLDAADSDAGPAPLTERVRCLFSDDTQRHECASSRGSCKGTGSCVVQISGPAAELVEWSASCGTPVTTTIDGADEDASFDCSVAIRETVTCAFGGAVTQQQCTSTLGSCTGLDSCSVQISGTPGDRIEWTSTCGIDPIKSKIDGIDEQVVFDCRGL